MGDEYWDSMLAEHLSAFNLVVDRQTRSRLLWLSAELLRWNERVNLTAITCMEDVIERHLVDSLTLASIANGSQRMLDVGSGGGFPGLPLKIVFDELNLVSVDSVGKKIHFQRHVIRHLGLKHCLALHTRIEKLSQRDGFNSGFDLIVSRAFASLDEFVSLALPYLSGDGRLVAMKGPDGENELNQKGGILKELKVSCVGIERKTLPRSGAERVLLVFKKCN